MTPTVEAFIAANRFGLGARPGELRIIAGDPRGWIGAQIAPRPALPGALADLPPSHETLTRIHEARVEGPKELRKMAREEFRALFMRETAARARAMLRTEQAFRERMVMFWSNHFTVSATRFTVGPVAGAYEREAIRPHVFGRFEDMLMAATRHPVMLSYLDNARSIGPNSKFGRRSGRGLNENHARELLELHTLGVDGGYTQADVTALARILTGWSHGGVRNKRAIRFLGPVNGRFEFRDRAHEPGDKTLLGRRYPEAGEQEGIDALKQLAHHPATARFIAAKLARHFIADDPPADAVDRIALVWREHDGDLAAVSRELIALDAVWRAPMPKIKTPYELIVSVLRGVDYPDVPDRALVGALRQLGHLPFRAPSPAGWPDRARDWISPEALVRRIEWARAASARLPRSLSPDRVLGETIGAVAAPETARMIAAAPSGEEGLAMIFAGPEFQRR
jgi:uncharacterized protein (DUF1800 family)